MTRPCRACASWRQAHPAARTSSARSRRGAVRERGAKRPRRAPPRRAARLSRSRQRGRVAHRADEVVLLRVLEELVLLEDARELRNLRATRRRDPSRARGCAGTHHRPSLPRAAPGWGDAGRRVAHLSRHGLVHDYLGLGGYSLAELVDGFFWARALCRHARTSQKMMLWGLNGRPCTLARLTTTSSADFSKNNQTRWVASFVVGKRKRRNLG